MKTLLFVFAVTPFCCSDLCAVLYDSVMANGLVKAAGKITRGSGQVSTRTTSASRGCSCSGGAASRAINRAREDEEDNNYYGGY